jgi:predicted nucleic acid-binding protein
MRFALDSNIILYVEGINDARRRDLARHLIGALRGLPIVIPVQALGEVLSVLIGKVRLPREDALEVLRPWQESYVIQETNRSIFADALELVARHAFRIWDAIILAAASFSGARTLFTEDMQDGFEWRHTRIVNPFAENPAPIVRALLHQS